MRYLPPILCALALAVAQGLYGGALRPVFALPAFALIGVAGALGMVCVFRANIPPPNFSCVTLVAVLAGWLFWREIVSPDVWLGFAYLRLTLACLVVYLLFACVITNPHHRLAFVVVLLVLALAQTVTAMWQFGHNHTGFPLPWFSEQLRQWYSERFFRSVHGFYLNHNHLAWFLNAAGLVALTLTCWGRWGLAAKIVCLYVGLMSFAGAILSSSRGGLLSLGVGLGFFFLLSGMALMIGARGRRRVALAAVLTGLLTMAGSAWFVYHGSYALQEKYARLLEDPYRSNIIAVVGRQFQIEPIWGTGPGSFMYYARQFRGLAFQFDDIYAHNDWAQIAADFGFPALALLLLCVVVHIANGLKSLRAVLLHRMAAYSRPQSHAAALLMASLCCLAMFATHSFFDFNMQIPANALLASAFLGMLANSGADATGQRTTGVGAVKRVVGSLATSVCGVWLLVTVWRAAGPEFQGLKAENALLAGDWENAAEFARKGLSYRQPSPGLHRALGESLLLQSLTLRLASARWQNYQDAAREFSEAARLAPLSDSGRLLLARALAKAGRPGRAETEAIETIRLNPAEGQSYRFYAQLLELSGRLPEAAGLYVLSGHRGNSHWWKELERVEAKLRARAEEKTMP